MAFVQKQGEEFIVCKRHNKLKGEGKRCITHYQDWFFVRHSPNIKNFNGFINLTSIHLPKEFIGKKVQLIARVKEELK